MKVVSNTSPLIFLYKIKKLEFLQGLEIIIPDEVYAEIKLGKEKGHMDYFFIDKLVREKQILMKNTRLLVEMPPNLDYGEKALISLAVRDGIEIVLVDDAKARLIARFYGLRPKGTVAIIKEQLDNKNITRNEFNQLIKKLVDVGFRIDKKILEKIITKY